MRTEGGPRYSSVLFRYELILTLQEGEDEEEMLYNPGQFFLDEDGKDAVPMSEVGLANRVSEMLEQRENKQVYVRGDQAVDYGRVMAAMAALQAAGASGIGLITEPPSKK